MTFWLINIIIFGGYSLLLYRMNKKDVFLIVAFLHLGLVAALRGLNVGSDTLYYANAYKVLAYRGHIRNHAMASSPGFIGYMKLISYIFPDRNGYMISTAIPILLGAFVLIKNFSKNYFASVYLYLTFYFYFLSMNISRQFLAIAMTLFCYYFLNKGKKLWALILYIAALSVHSAAIIFGVYFVLHLIKWTEKRVLAAGVCLLFGSSLIPRMLNIFVRIFPNYQWMLENSFITNYASGGRSAMVITVYSIFAVLLMLYWILWSKKKLMLSFGGSKLCARSGMNEAEIQMGYELILMLLIVAVIEIFYPTVIIFTRMVNTLFVYIIILLPNALQNMARYRKIVSLAVMAPLVAYMWMQIAGDYSGVLNYTFYGF